MALQLRPEAREDLNAAARWYDGQEKGLGRQFLAEFRLLFQRIRALIRRFPYGVIDVPMLQQDCIVVLAVLHCGGEFPQC
jgi:toxin ParE1/3/4